MALTGLMTALTVVLAQIAIPMPFGVPITLQTFAVALCGYVLGYRFGFASTLIYVLLGAIGVPVFSHFKGGLHFLFASPTGGFLFGLLLLSLFTGLSHPLKWKRHERLYAILFGLIGAVFCHLLGSMQYASVASVSFTAAVLTVSLPFIIKDFLSVVLAYLLSLKLKRFYVNK